MLLTIDSLTLDFLWLFVMHICYDKKKPRDFVIK